MTKILDEAKRYLSKGWKPLPVSYKSKRPTIKDWSNVVLTEEELPQHFKTGRQNISILLGEKSNNLVDVDLDSAEAVKLADWFLPETKAVFGRSSKPRSHRIYCSDFHKTERFDLDSTIVEIRSTGGQTVFPPSTHESGEKIEWVSEAEPLFVEAAELRRAVTLLASACVISTFWREGIRHEFSLATSGMLLRNGFSFEETTNFIRAICFVTGDDEIEDRLTCIKTNLASLENNQNVYGLPRIQELTSEKIASKIGKWLDIQSNYENGSNQPPETGFKPKSVAERLVILAEDFAFFHTAKRDCFALVPFATHTETMKLSGKDFTTHLTKLLWEDSRKTANAQSLQEALSILRGKALFDSPTREVFIRFAEKDGEIFIDLGSKKWQSIKVTKDGWRVIESKDVPVVFRRTPGVLPLPMPTPNHNGLEELKDFVNIFEDDFVLLCVWAVSAMRPGYSFPVLAIHGGQGSAKSTLTKVLRDLIDPNSSPLRSKPKSERDLMIAAQNSWILSFDNLSELTHDFSDSLCRISTGGGLATRKLHTDEDEIILEVRRPLILNGINELATRSDLLERCLMLNLPTIEASRRQDEETFNKKFEEAKPRLLGALLDKLSESMRELPNVKLTEKPRMADFAKFAYAGFGEKFLERYTANRDDANQIAIDNSAIGEPLLKHLEGLLLPQWEGTAKQLLDALEKVIVLHFMDGKDLPRKANKLSADLKRIEPNLAAMGWKVTRSRAGDKTRTRRILITKTNEGDGSKPSASSEASVINPKNPEPVKMNGSSSRTNTSEDNPAALDHPAANGKNGKLTGREKELDESDDGNSQISISPKLSEEELETFEV